MDRAAGAMIRAFVLGACIGVLGTVGALVVVVEWAYRRDPPYQRKW